MFAKPVKLCKHDSLALCKTPKRLSHKETVTAEDPVTWVFYLTFRLRFDDL